MKACINGCLGGDVERRGLSEGWWDRDQLDVMFSKSHAHLEDIMAQPAQRADRGEPAPVQPAA